LRKMLQKAGGYLSLLKERSSVHKLRLFGVRGDFGGADERTGVYAERKRSRNSRSQYNFLQTKKETKERKEKMGTKGPRVRGDSLPEPPNSWEKEGKQRTIEIVFQKQ